MTELKQTPPNQPNLIKSYENGVICINKNTYSNSLIISHNQLINKWIFPELDQVIALAPELVIIGTGPAQQFIEPAKLAPLYERNIGVEVMNTRAACRTFNILLAEDRNVVAALVL